MGRVIDIDSHSEPPPGWLDEFPMLKDALPPRIPESDPQFWAGDGGAEAFGWFVAVDLQRGLPVDQRISGRDLATPVLEMFYDRNRPEGFIYPGADQHPTLDTTRRLAWLDQQGIDVQLLVSGEAYTMARAIDDPVVAMDACEAANSWMLDNVGVAIDRLKPVVTVRLDDMDRAIRELERCRNRGSRTFLLSGEPVNGIPHFDPHFDRLWSAACDLGIMPMLHVGMGPAYMHPGWGRTSSPALMKRMATSMSWQNAPILLNAMIFGGVFERYPKLTLLIGEYGIEWVPFVVQSMDGRAAPAAPLLGDYELSLTPSEFMRRNVRITPLPSEAQNPVRLLESLPECVVFSTDYPHLESNPEPAAHYASILGNVEPALRDQFMGENIASVFAGLGDPL